MEFIDTHTHILDPEFEPREDQIIQKALEVGVTHLINADIDSRERPSMFALAARHPGVVHPMLGLYPGSVDQNWKEEIASLQDYLSESVVAVGEIGLDYHYGLEWREEQKEAFRVQLELASQWDLPVNIHLRDATEDFFAVMSDCARSLHLRGNIHAFSSSPEVFERLCSLGGDWYVGIGGVLTFKKASIARDIVRIPLDRIVLETDAPYLAPTPYRGTRNESAYIPIIADTLARCKGVSLEEVAKVTTHNAKQLFAI